MKAGGVGALLEVWDRSAGSFCPIADANGNVRKLITQGGGRTVVGEYEYGPFGEVISISSGATQTNPFRFSTKYQDDESGQLYYGYRYYDAGIGR